MKSRLLAGMIAVMTLSGISASTLEDKQVQASSEFDTRIIVEVNKSLENLSEDDITESQNEVIGSIKRNVTPNFKLLNRYNVLNNAFVIEVNSEDVDAIRALDCVASVTVDKIHAKQDISDGNYYSARFTHPDPVDGEDEGSNVDNISAITMNKPNGTNDGEGTVIAILDNEFYFRGVHQPSSNVEDNDDGTAWNHAVFKPLDSTVAKKFTFENLTSAVSKTNAERLDGANAGEEGSLYYNTKVPFYYDYGGESTNYGKVGEMDYDVSSTSAYHGSHVASIAAANADTYKGIAPKAQLACMKVFTNYVADETGKQMGFGDSSGAYDTAILSALEDAITLGVDGINMSLGSDLGDFDGDSITMKTLASLAGGSNNILTAISAGNAGKTSYSFTGGYGNWTTDMVETGILGSYANSGEATIVASGQPTQVYYENAIRTGGKNIAYEDQIINREGQAPDFAEDSQHRLNELIETYGSEIGWVYVPGFGAATDYNNVDPKGKVAVVNRGSTSFADKYNIAVDNGAIGVIIINNDPTANEFNFRCSFGDDFNPSVPCALVLYKDKPIFEAQQSGTFEFIFKDVSENDLARTIATYSSDGGRFNYDLKPDITTPGDNIRGAVPPQKKEHREETPYSTYEYLSGTSMAAPNYAGSQSLILSKVAKGIYADGTASRDELKTLKEYRKTIDMRLMSTADPMLDGKANPENPETAEPNYTSPRMQGAGMVNLDKAYNTDVYLEGLDLAGKGIGKSKICLYNSEDIANGDLNLKFLAHNSGVEKNYIAKITVMRPAIATNNKVIPDMYNYTGETDDIAKIPGLEYYVSKFNPRLGEEEVVKVINSGTAKQFDVIKLTKQIEYYTSEEDFVNKTNTKLFTAGYYYNSATSGIKWEPLPSYDYQSVQDAVITTKTQNVTIPADVNGAGTLIELDSISLEEYEDDILSKFPYGCAIEGFVELLEGGDRKLSIPYLGFFSGTDKNGKTLEDAPVVEPFTFEKDPSSVYPSDLVNDVTKQLVGKDNCEFGSTWTVGYAESPLAIDTDKVLTNEKSFEGMNGWYKVGVDPSTEKYFDNPGENIYVGNPEKTNTMIIQQFVMRSVKDNFFEIKDANGKVVYKSALNDMLFGDKQLYKSHVDANYLSAGYVAHRAYAIIPLYDILTGKTFADGKYTLEFNYQLAYNDGWVKKSYNFILDATPPTISKIKEYKDDNGVDRIRFDIEETKVSKATLGIRYVDVKFDATNKSYYIDETKETILNAMDQLGALKNGQKRLVVTITDAARGQSTAIIHFFGETFSNYVIAQGTKLETNQDFVKNGQTIKWYVVSNDEDEDDVEFTQKNFVTISTNIDKWPENEKAPEEKKGCFGSLVASSAVVSVALAIGATMLLKKKKSEVNYDEN